MTFILSELCFDIYIHVAYGVREITPLFHNQLGMLVYINTCKEYKTAKKDKNTQYK